MMHIQLPKMSTDKDQEITKVRNIYIQSRNKGKYGIVSTETKGPYKEKDIAKNTTKKVKTTRIISYI